MATEDGRVVERPSDDIRDETNILVNSIEFLLFHVTPHEIEEGTRLFGNQQLKFSQHVAPDPPPTPASKF
ncbi:hypothetical protein I4U23_006736 [Adineta vaga]|nr:hypothetical protein I4U23_006736 [Adineta vaga]